MGAVALRGQRPESRPTERRPVGGRDGPPEVAAAGKARWPLGDGVKGLALLGHDAVDDEPPSPARPPPVLVGEQVRNLPKARQPSIMAPAAGEHGLRTQFYGRKSVHFSDSLLTAPDTQYEFACFLLVMAVLLGAILGAVAYYYAISDVRLGNVPPATSPPGITNASVPET
ncbi:uncharacterized protein [Dermacentor albipictus]|uniref:uncharacterized protein isoform X2 n=1 Tax=Dermacentor albipictus TaxID=60249 RepID=UPI0031FE40EB